MKSYVEVLADGSTAAKMRERLTLTGPNSAAYRYLDHMANTQEAGFDAGMPQVKTAVTPVGANAFKMCPDPAYPLTCTTFGGFKVNRAGKLVDLTVDGQRVGPRLTVGNGQSVTTGGTRFTLLTAYDSIVSNVLVVTMNVQTGAEPITINPSLWSYRGPDGQPMSVAGGIGATHLVNHASLVAVVSFDSAKAGGRLTLGGCLARLVVATPGDSSKDCPGASFSGVMKVG